MRAPWTTRLARATSPHRRASASPMRDRTTSSAVTTRLRTRGACSRSVLPPPARPFRKTRRATDTTVRHAAHVPPHAPRSARRQVRVECALHVCADCMKGVAYVCRNKPAPDEHCSPTSNSMKGRSSCYRGLFHTAAETDARGVCKLLKQATEKCTPEALADPEFGRCNPFDECATTLQELQHDEAFVRAAALGIDARTLACASDGLKADKDFMLTIIGDFKQPRGWVLQYASEALKGDEEFATRAVQSAGQRRVVDVLELCQQRIIAQHDVATWHRLWKKAAQAYPREIARSESLPGALRDSVAFWRDVPGALEYMPETIKGDAMQVLELIEYKVGTLGRKWERLLSKVKLNIREDVKTLHLLRTNGHEGLCDTGYKRSDSAFMLMAVRVDVRALQCASEELRSSREFMLNAVQLDVNALDYTQLLPRMEQGPFWLAVVQSRNVDVLERAPQELRRRTNFMRTIVEGSKDISALQYAGAALLSDRCFMIDAVRVSVHALQHADPALRKNKQGFMSDALKEVGKEALQYADPTLLGNKKFMGDALEEVGEEALQYAKEPAKSFLEKAMPKKLGRTAKALPTNPFGHQTPTSTNPFGRAPTSTNPHSEVRRARRSSRSSQSSRRRDPPTRSDGRM